MEDQDNFDFKILKIKIQISISSNHLNLEKYRSQFLRPSPTQIDPKYNGRIPLIIKRPKKISKKLQKD